MSLITSVPSLIAQRNLNTNTIGLNNSMTKLATGSRINRGADDPAGLITSENFKAVLAWLDAESRALSRADHVVATADGALGEVSGMLAEARALTIANENTAGVSSEEHAANQMQIDSLMSSINRISNSTTFNGDRLLDGTATITAAGQSISIDSIVMGSIGSGQAAFDALTAAASSVSTMRGELGAFSKNIIGAEMNNISTMFINTAAANSQIRDTDYAAETSNFARFATLQQASMMTLTMANANQGMVLGLLGL